MNSGVYRFSLLMGVEGIMRVRDTVPSEIPGDLLS